MLFSDATALPVKTTLGYSLRELAKLKIPLVGSVDAYMKGPAVELGAILYRRYLGAAAPQEHARDAW